MYSSGEDSSEEDDYSSEDDQAENDLSGYYYCSSCRTYHRNGANSENNSISNNSTFMSHLNTYPTFSKDDLHFQHPLFSILEDPKRPTQGSRNVVGFVKRSMQAYFKQCTEEHNKTKVTASESSSASSSNVHQVDKELLEKAKSEVQKYEQKKEKQYDELVEEIIQFNLGESDNTALIELNIDDKIYKTTKKTIMKYDSLIKVMIENKENGGFDIETDSEGRIVFKAVPHSDYFKYILMFFRGDEESQNQEIPDEITSSMKKKFKFITEGFNLANYLEFYEICNFFCVKDLLTLTEKKIENFENPLALESLSEKYRNIEQEKEEYAEKIKVNEKAILDTEENIRELVRQLRSMEEKKSKLLVEKLRLKKEQELISKLLGMKALAKKEDVSSATVEEFDIIFNIGGEEFSFKSSDIQKYESSLLYKLMIKCKENKSIFLDRDPSLFSYIYTFIKNDTVPTGLANQKQIKLIEESIFFGIDELTVKIDIFRYPVEELSEEDREIRETESILRKLFSYDRENPLIDDPFVNLISVFDNVTDFYPIDQPILPNLLFDFEHNDTTNYKDVPIIASGKEEFDFNFNLFTGKIFEELDWNGVFIAGGAVQTWCRAYASLYNKKVVQYALSTSQDIDIFLYGLSKSEAEDKIRHIYSLVKKVKQRDVIVVRTKYTVTFCCPGMPAVQVVTRLYKSVAEVLIGFDIDSCCVGYDGNKVWCLPRFRRAFNRRYNLVDIERQSLTYELRLRKYAFRGFRVLVPGYKPELVRKPGLLNKTYIWNQNELSGLALLLYYQTESSAYTNPFTSSKRNIDNISLSSESTDNEESQEGKQTDYGDFFCHRIMSYPFSHMMISYKEFIQRRTCNFVCAFNDVESIIDSKKILTSNHTIPPNIEWITEQPHRQLLGSLFPVFENFYVCAYDNNYRKSKKDSSLY